MSDNKTSFEERRGFPSGEGDGGDGSSCSQVRERLPLYVGEDLEAGVMVLVRRHLAECGACRRAADRAAQARGAFATHLAEEALLQPNLWAGLRAELVREGRIQASPHEANRDANRSVATPEGPRPLAAESGVRRPRLLRYAGGLAAAAAIVMVATLVPSPWNRSGDGGVREVREGVPSAPEMVVGVTPAQPAATGGGIGLQRLEPGEEGIWDSAVPAEFRLRTTAPTDASDTNSLANYPDYR